MSIKRNPSAPPPLLPRAFRKRMSKLMLMNMSLVHHVNLDAMHKGDVKALVDFGASVLTWGNVAARLSLGQPEMQRQLVLLDRLMSQVEISGSLTLSAEDYDLAREGVIVMDLLAQEVDLMTAAWCAERSTAEIQRRFPRGWPDVNAFAQGSDCLSKIACKEDARAMCKVASLPEACIPGDVTESTA